MGPGFYTRPARGASVIFVRLAREGAVDGRYPATTGVVTVEPSMAMVVVQRNFTGQPTGSE